MQHVIGLLRARYVHVTGVNEAEGGKAGTPELKPCLDLKYPSCGPQHPYEQTAGVPRAYSSGYWVWVACSRVWRPTINTVQATQEERRVSGSNDVKGWCDLG